MSKKRQRDGDSDGKEEKKARKQELFIPPTLAPHFKPIPESTVSLLEPEPGNEHAKPVAIEMIEAADTVPLPQCDLIVPAGFAQYTEAKKLDIKDKHSVAEILLLQAEQAKRCATEQGYIVLSELPYFERLCKTTLPKLVEPGSNAAAQHITRTLLTQACIHAWCVLNGRVFMRRSADWSKPQFLWIFFASDFGATSEPEEPPTDAQNVTLAQLLRSVLSKVDEGLWRPVLWEKDPFKGLRAQRFQSVPIAASVLADFGVVTKEVQVRVVKACGLVVTTYPTGRNVAAAHSMPQLYVHPHANPFLPVLPPPPCTRELPRGEWEFLCSSLFTTAARRKRGLREMAKLNMSGCYEQFDYTNTSEAQRPYMMRKTSQACVYAICSRPSAIVNGRPNDPAALSNTNVFALETLMRPVNLPSHLQLAPSPSPEGYLCIAGSPSAHLNLFVQENGNLPWQFLDFLREFEKDIVKVPKYTAIGTTTTSFAHLADSLGEPATAASAFAAYLNYRRCLCVLPKIADALFIAHKVSDVTSRLAFLDLLQHGERIFYAALAAKSEQLTEEMPDTVCEQLLWLDMQPPALTILEEGKAHTLAQKKASPGSALRALVKKCTMLAHAFIEEFGKGEITGASWSAAIEKLHSSKPLPPFARELLRALVLCTTKTVKDCPDAVLAAVREASDKGDAAADLVRGILKPSANVKREDLETLKFMNSDTVVNAIVRQLTRKQ